MKRPEITKISVDFVQDGNTLGTTDEFESLTLDIQFQLGEDGPFYVLTTNTGWSFDRPEELQKLVNVATAPLQEIKSIFNEKESV